MIDASGQSVLRIARVAIALAILLTFWPVLGHEFGGWDDEMNLTGNKDFNPPSPGGVLRYWQRPAFDIYAPLTFTAWGAISTLAWRGDHLIPMPFHAANLLVHLLASLIAFNLLLRLTQSKSTALCGTLLFALHPVQVEPVAWISGLKDVLAGLGAVVALWLYLGQGTWRYLLASSTFVLAMLSKPSAVVVPVVAIILDFATGNRTFGRSITRIWPWILLTAPIIVVARKAQPATFVAEVVGLADRPLVALDALAFYLRKLFWPLNLAVDYGRSPQWVIARGWAAMTWLVPIAAVVVGLIVLRWTKWLAVALSVFCVALAPVLGIMPFDFQTYSTVADHYLYLAMLGPAIGLAGCLAKCHAKTVWIGVWIVCSVLSALSHCQARTWRDAFTISQQALRVNPSSWASHGHLAGFYLRRGLHDKAIPHARRAIELNPKFAKALDQLGQAYSALRQFNQAETAYRRAIEVEPRDLAARIGLANVLADTARFEQALEQYQQVLLLAPYDLTALNNMASVLAEMGRFDQAMHYYDLVLAIDPAHVPALIGRQRAAERRAAGR